MTTVSEIIERPSPNKDERVAGRQVDHLILHYTGMQSAEAAVERLTDPEARVSAHYTVAEDGRIFRHVSEEERAWHAGVSHWRGEADMNGASIGIEIANPGHEFGYTAFPDAQMNSVTNLCKEVLSRHPIPARNVIGHSDVAPMRKMDPGEKFPWQQLAGEGVGLWPQADRSSDLQSLGPMTSSPAVRLLQQDFEAYGYGLMVNGMYDAATQAVVTAFQRHFRPLKVDGIADAETQALLKSLLTLLDG